MQVYFEQSINMCSFHPPQGSLGIQGPQGPPGKEGQRVSKLGTTGRHYYLTAYLFLNINKNKPKIQQADGHKESINYPKAEI